MTRPIAITCGDPLGIGAEVAIRAAALAGLRTREVRPLLVGPRELYARAARLLGLEIDLVSWSPDQTIPDLHPDQQASSLYLLEPEDGQPPEVAAVATAAALCLSGSTSAMTTAPIHKASLTAAGFGYPGHTEFLAALCGKPVEDAVMLFAGGRLKVALLTTHLPLSAVPGAITTDRVVRVSRTVAKALVQDLGISNPRIGLCGLNPHAGEEGTLGREEQYAMMPAVKVLREEGIDVSRPLPADTLFSQALEGRYDLVLAAYHDQGLAPLKAVDFGRSVNMTAGLPLIRTSVDHGTARDIAWTGRAKAESMAAALDLAGLVSKQRAEGT